NSNWTLKIWVNFVKITPPKPLNSISFYSISSSTDDQYHYCYSMCNYLGICFQKDKKKKKKREERHISLESPSEFAKRTGPELDIDTTGLAEKTERVVETTSNINHLKTTEITQIYRLPCEHYTTVEEITAFVGYEILKSHEI